MNFEIVIKLINEDFIARFNEKMNNKKFFKKFFTDLNFRIVVLIRLQHYFFNLKNVKGKLAATLLRNYTIKNYGIEIGNRAQIQGGLNIHHINGIVIGESVLIGKNFNIYQNVTLGSVKGGYPKIGDGVTIYPGAIVVGDIRIGNYSRIGPNVVVREDIKDNSTLYFDNRIYKELQKK